MKENNNNNEAEPLDATNGTHGERENLAVNQQILFASITDSTALFVRIAKYLDLQDLIVLMRVLHGERENLAVNQQILFASITDSADLFVRISEYLDLQDLIVLMRVSKHLQRVTKQDLVWLEHARSVFLHPNWHVMGFSVRPNYHLLGDDMWMLMERYGMRTRWVHKHWFDYGLHHLHLGGNDGLDYDVAVDAHLQQLVQANNNWSGQFQYLLASLYPTLTQHVSAKAGRHMQEMQQRPVETRFGTHHDLCRLKEIQSWQFHRITLDFADVIHAHRQHFDVERIKLFFWLFQDITSLWDYFRHAAFWLAFMMRSNCDKCEKNRMRINRKFCSCPVQKHFPWPKDLPPGLTRSRMFTHELSGDPPEVVADRGQQGAADSDRWRWFWQYGCSSDSEEEE